MSSFTLRLTILLLMIFLSTYNAVSAQDEAHDFEQSASISVSVDFVSSLELVPVRNLSFPAVSPGQRIIEINPVTDPEAGLLMAIGRPDASIRISYERRQELVNNRSGQPIPFSYVVTTLDEDNQLGSELIEAENREFRLNEDGRIYFWIGGSVEVERAPSGSYSGEFTIEIEYI